MSYQSLHRAGLIESCSIRQVEIRDQMDIARRDVKTASGLMNLDLDWALIVAYNAALQASLAFMYSRGYRPRGSDRHKTVIRFLRATLDSSFKSQLNRLDRMRKKRHQAVYRIAGAVSAAEAKATIDFADNFVTQVGDLI